MYKILNELNAMQSLPAIEDKSDEVDMPDENDTNIEIFRMEDEPDESEGDCGCGGNEESNDPIDDAVSMFRDWLTQNVEFIQDADASEDEEMDEVEPGGIESELTEPTDDSMEDNTDMDADGELGTGPDELEEPNRQGMIRTVPGAHLVYKRKTPDGFYDELWFFNIGKQTKHDELVVRKAILAGTDIPETGTKSEDGSQSYDLWTAGNGQLLKIQGLPN